MTEGRFLPSYPPNNPKNQNFEKMKTINVDHMMIWSMTDRIFCYFGPFFALLSH